jgi:hypothetical protein
LTSEEPVLSQHLYPSHWNQDRSADLPVCGRTLCCSRRAEKRSKKQGIQGEKQWLTSTAKVSATIYCLYL